ncbi:MAG: sigma-70 family RNA polymerase sigma factor [Chloroflexota bacterium]
MSDIDRELAQRSKRGEKDAYCTLVERHHVAVFNVALRMLGNFDDAEDVTQETFIRAYKSFLSYDLTRPLAPWFKKIATNLSINRLNATKDTVQLNLDIQLKEASGNAMPEIKTITSEEQDQVRDAIHSLPLRYRTVIELRHFQDLSYNDIALTLKLPISDVKSDLFRARKMLAIKLKDLITDK